MIERLTDFPIDPEDLAFRDEETLKDHVFSLENVEATTIGQSRDGREMYGLRFGHGDKNVSVIAGCHADEPIGPMTAQILSRLINRNFPELLETFRFHIVPQMNPDGAERNRDWFVDPLELSSYLDEVLREQPGDDIEFGFGQGRAVRPECRAAQDFLRGKAPFSAHFSLHGMAFAEGVWCLICKEWGDQATPLMDALTDLCGRLGVAQHDIERNGEKGFYRLREGFCTTPTAQAMRKHFKDLKDDNTARKFQPSSMDWIRSLGGDPVCIVSELPLFLMGLRSPSPLEPLSAALKEDLTDYRADPGPESLQQIIDKYRLDPMPLELQVRLQTSMFVLALTTLL